MNSQLERTSARGWIPALATLTIMGLLIVLIVTVDGRVAAWSQHLAQNAADAAALAGARSLHEITGSAAFSCAEASDTLIMAQIQLYAELSQASDTAAGLNVQAYYLTQAAAGDYHALLHPETGQRWKIGATGSVPCEAVHGLAVEVYYPQETLLTRLFAIEHARVVVEAAAASEHEAPWAIRLVSRERITGDRLANNENTNAWSGPEMETNGRIRVYLTGNAIMAETLLGKRAAVSGTNDTVRARPAAGPAAGTKVGLPFAAERVIQSVSDSSGFGQ